MKNSITGFIRLSTKSITKTIPINIDAGCNIDDAYLCHASIAISDHFRTEIQKLRNAVRDNELESAITKALNEGGVPGLVEYLKTRPESVYKIFDTDDSIGGKL